MDIDTNELERLLHGAAKESETYGMTTVEVNATCADAATLLARCREVMTLILSQSKDAWPTSEAWFRLLPGWFLEGWPERFGAVPRADCEECRRASVVTPRLPTPWSINRWLDSFGRDWRSWYWWDAMVVDPHHLRIDVAIDGWPYNEVTLRWLLLAAGATHIEF